MVPMAAVFWQSEHLSSSRLAVFQESLILFVSLKYYDHGQGSFHKNVMASVDNTTQEYFSSFGLI